MFPLCSIASNRQRNRGGACYIIPAIYAIEKRIRGMSAAERLAVRQAESRPLMEAFKTWAEGRLAEVSAKSPLAGAIRYTLSRSSRRFRAA